MHLRHLLLATVFVGLLLSGVSCSHKSKRITDSEARAFIESLKQEGVLVLPLVTVKGDKLEFGTP